VRHQEGREVEAEAARAEPHVVPAPCAMTCSPASCARGRAATQAAEPRAAQDAITTMPPAALWLSGRDAIADIVIAHIWPHGPLRLVPTLANDAPGFAVYLPQGFGSLMVVELDADSVAAFHSFREVDPARYLHAVAEPYR
jgi:hypothetical protein